ncbi:MAG: sporulation initiation factor Spo0A C-terminal domain-containing protein [Bacillota bacterium]|nr:sporulation initiation factor Spo0A C-terminal domain-containing protein [Bacillota bacterium]
MKTAGNRDPGRHAHEAWLMPGSYDFYVATSDRDVMRHIDELIRQRGFIGVADTAGRMHYMVDARDGINRGVHRILTVAAERANERADRVHPDPLMLHEVVEASLLGAGISQRLRGYAVLRYLLLQTAVDESRLRPLGKGLYPLAAKYYRITTTQVERAIRYAAADAGLEMSNMELIGHLHSDVMQRLRERMDQGRQELPAAAP